MRDQEIQPSMYLKKYQPTQPLRLASRKGNQIHIFIVASLRQYYLLTVLERTVLEDLKIIEMMFYPLNPKLMNF